MSQYSIISELHGGVGADLFGESHLFRKPKRETYDRHGIFLFPVTSGLSPEKREEEEKKHQERMMERMDMYQRYHDLIQDEAYAPRGSKMTCSYGTKTALLDTMEDHGVYKGDLPVMTCKDCREQNLHSFGSCMCPEIYYKGRIDMGMTVPRRNEEVAEKAPWNQYPHLCIPLINEEEGWHQTFDRVWIENEDGGAERVLVCRAFLVCRYGGMILLEEVSESKSTDEIVEDAYQTLQKWFLKGYEGGVSKERLDIAMEDMAMYGAENKIGHLREVTIPSSETVVVKGMLKRINDCIDKGRDDKYDTMILAWTNYWNMTMSRRCPSGFTPVRADVIKAIALIESDLGADNTAGQVTKNPERDIMQAVDPRNPVFWIAAGEASKKSIIIVRSKRDVDVLGADAERVYTFSRENLHTPSDPEKKFFGNGSAEAVREVASEDLSRYYSGKVTPELSLAVGVGNYCMLLNGENNSHPVQLSENAAVKSYHNGKNPNYTAEVDMVLENMGVNKLGTQK